MTELETISLVLAVVGAGAAVSAFEWMSLAETFRDDGLFAWPVRKTRMRLFLGARTGPVFDALFRYPNVLVVYGVQALAGIAMVVSMGHPMALAGEAAVLASASQLCRQRGNSGRNGSDQLIQIVCIAMALCLASSTPWVLRVGLVFLTAQLSLHYMTGGWLRIMQPTWRDGSDLLAVFRQHTYGNRRMWEFLKSRKRLTALMSMSVLIFECFFPLGLLLPRPYLLGFLAFGASFHLMNAAILGLSTFTWTFVGLYPAYAWASAELRALIFA